jgi:hypothetical protein
MTVELVPLVIGFLLMDAAITIGYLRMFTLALAFVVIRTKSVPEVTDTVDSYKKVFQVTVSVVLSRLN